MLALDPQALSHLATGRTVALVSGTNGKTTTTKLLASALPTTDGAPVASNFQGANLPSGLVTALAERAGRGPAVLEVDEAWLGEVAAQVLPAALVLLNLSRDQLDRHHEVRHLAQRWRSLCQGLAPVTFVVANADDPLVAWAAAAAAGQVTWVAAGARWRLDAAGCPECGGRLSFGLAAPLSAGAGGDLAEPGGAYDDGHWQCDGCGLSRPAPDLWLEQDGANLSACWRSGPRVALKVSLPGRCNRFNALMALATAVRLGATAPEAAHALAGVDEVAGRYSTVSAGAGSAKLLLAKNPAGWVEALDMLSPAPAPVVVAINAHGVDGRDTSWIWDVPFENLRGRSVFASGERALDMSVRLHYADVAHQVEPDTWKAVAAMNSRAVDVVANYSAFQQLRSRRLLPAPGAPK